MDRSELIYNVERAMEHDRQAIEALYNYTYSRMYALVYKLCSDKNDVEDILQESYTTAFLKLNTLEENAAFYNWLKKIVINKWRNYSRDLSSFDTITIYDATREFEDSALMEHSPHEVIENSETNSEIWELVNQLPEHQRVCVLLFYYYDMKVEDIAEVLNIPQGSVKSRLYYGRERLKKDISERGLYLGAVLPPASVEVSAANSEILSNVLDALEAASKGSTAVIAAKSAGGAIMLKLGIGFAALLTAGGIIVGFSVIPERKQPPAPPTTTTHTAASAETTTTTATVTTTTTATTVSTTTTTTSPQPFAAFEYRVMDSGIMITKYIGDESNVVIPDSLEGLPVIAVGDNAFKYCNVLKNVVICDSVRYIGDNSFRECPRLCSVSLGSGVNSIGDMAFLGCGSLQGLYIPRNVSEVGMYAFAYCTGLTNVEIAEGVHTLGIAAFSQCTTLKCVSLPTSLQAIGRDQFAGAPSDLVLSLHEDTYAYQYAVTQGYNYNTR